MTSNPDVPPFIGYVETTVHALRLIHAARQGVIPRITRRLNDSERRTMIKSGAVFVFSVEESTIKRWTDGLLWSPSRIVGNFLVYREINERTSSRGNHKKPFPTDEPSVRAVTPRHSSDQLSAGYGRGQLSAVHASSEQGTFKPNGLIKKTITVTIDGSDLHLISYYTSEDIRSGKLKRPTSRPDIMGLYMPPHIFRLTNFRVPPKIEIGPDSKPRLVCEAEDPESIECKVEEQMYNVPGSPTWGSPTSPIENPYPSSSLYPLTPSQNVGGSGLYNRGSTGDRWQIQNEGGLVSGLSRQDLSWSPSVATMSPSHSMSRHRDSSALPQADSWSSLHSQSGRWQGSSHEVSSSPGSYVDRSRPRSNHLYDGNSVIRRHNQSESVSSSTFGRRYSPNGSREATAQRIWHSRESDNKERRSSPHSSASFSPSPTLPFSAQGYNAVPPTYTSAWTPHSTSLMDTPTLHPISTHVTGLSYPDSSYPSGSGSLSSPEEYNVE